MKIKLRIADCQLPIAGQSGRVVSPLAAAAHGVTRPACLIANRKSQIVNGFTLIEVLVVVLLMSLIVLALMAVFTSTQTAFRSGVTSSDVLEGGRSTMELIAQDLREMAPSSGVSNNAAGAVNFFVTNNFASYSPLTNSLPPNNAQRVNLLEWIFILGRENQKWTGTGYIVNSGSTSSLYPLYRFYAETNVSTDPRTLFNSFNSAVNTAIATGQWSSMSHLVDGVVHLTARAYNTNGVLLADTEVIYGGQTNYNQNIRFSSSPWGDVGLTMFGRTVPAAVEIQLGVLEDRTLQRAESLAVPNQPPSPASANQWRYLSARAGQVHLFRQHIMIPNVDPSVYQ